MSKQSQEVQDHVMTVNMEAQNPSETKLRGRLLASKYRVKQGSSFQGNQARGRAFMLGAEEARQDANIMTRVMGSGEGYGIAVECTRDSGLELETVGKIGPSKSSQSLSIAHKWAVEID
ncbi:hypothetical protein Tco_0682386 [Tanacetum coccineum]|uniref:Uncharacterized protein n=1 Tax=Tanacetum coccineum TaxID=301880 RepID=A0ABQ4XRZ6_9ASTR